MVKSSLLLRFLQRILECCRLFVIGGLGLFGGAGDAGRVVGALQCARDLDFFVMEIRQSVEIVGAIHAGESGIHLCFELESFEVRVVHIDDGLLTGGYPGQFMRPLQCACPHPSETDASDERAGRRNGQSRARDFSCTFPFPFHTVVYALHHCRVETVFGHERGPDDTRLQAGDGRLSFVPAVLFSVPCHIALLCPLRCLAVCRRPCKCLLAPVAAAYEACYRLGL